jgi:hypothetical protein
MDAPNPLIPAGYDVLWTVVVVALAIAVLAALVSIARAASRMSALMTLGWVLIVLVFPFLGVLAWLVAGRRFTRAVAHPRG